jgi:MoxR-like ATPase
VDQHLAAGAATVRRVLSLDDAAAMTGTARTVHVDVRIREYAVRLARATRNGRNAGVPALAGWVRYGASPRAAVALARAAQALALLRGRSYVIPEDVKEVAPAVLRHRLVLSLEAQAEAIDVEGLVRELLLAVEVP